MTTTLQTITADTALFMFTAGFSGYSLVDSFLGNTSASDWKPEDRDALIGALTETATNYLSDGGIWLSEEEARTAENAAMEAGGKICYATVNPDLTEFTVTDVADKIIEAGMEERADTD